MTLRRQNQFCAFTLVELLMVIAVVGILATLLLAAATQAKARVQRVQCANNVRQLGLALQEFRTDHHFYPPGFDPSVWDENRNWKDALGNEMNLNMNHEYSPKGIWHCPSSHRPASWNEPENVHFVYEDYGYNAFGLNNPWPYTSPSLGLAEHWFSNLPKQPAQPTPHVMESEVATPGEMIAIGDMLYGSPDIILDGQIFERGSDHAVSSFLPQLNHSESTKRAHARHQNRANVVFCDGHVESPTLQFLFADTSDEALSRWNRDHLPHRERLSP
jgi:prepilin-type processing-associated H-X9-DG protein/prepilin-type N-terminal cleavage/methylation domain-containing protein